MGNLFRPARRRFQQGHGLPVQVESKQWPFFGDLWRRRTRERRHQIHLAEHPAKELVSYKADSREMSHCQSVVSAD